MALDWRNLIHPEELDRGHHLSLFVLTSSGGPLQSHLSGIMVAPAGPTVSHLIFTDDNLVLLITMLMELRSCLHCWIAIVLPGVSG